MGTDHQVRKRLVRGVDKGLILGQMGRGTGWITTMIIRLEGALQAAVRDAGGELDILSLAVIQTACRYERLALFAQRELRRRADELSPDQLLAYQKTIPWASAQRDACIRRLKIRRDPVDILDALYSSLPDPDDGNGDGNGTSPPPETAQNGVSRADGVGDGSHTTRSDDAREAT